MKWIKPKQRLQARLDKQNKFKTEWMLLGWEYRNIEEIILQK